MATFISKTPQEEFGENLRNKYFSHHNPDLVRLNNGSFGACPSVVSVGKNTIFDEWLSNPDDFWHLLPQKFTEVQNDIALRLIGNAASGKDLVIVDNLTTAVSIITSSIIAQITDPNAVILLTNWTYNAVTLAFNHACKQSNSGVCIEKVELPFPLISEDSHEIIIQAYQKKLYQLQQEGKNIVFASIDHISSIPAILMPVKELINVCRQYRVKEILIDGAHSPGQINMNCIPSLDCDYYVANLHKWCFAPTSVAFLWISPNAPSRLHLHHPIVSHSYNQGLQAECCMLATRDYSSLLSVPFALDFLDSLGGIENVAERNSILLTHAEALLSSSFKTQGLSQTISTRSPSLCMVACPQILGSSYDDGENLRLKLRKKGIVIQKLHPIFGDRLYLRLSAAVYNTIEEFELLRDEILKLVEQLENL